MMMRCRRRRRGRKRGRRRGAKNNLVESVYGDIVPANNNAKTPEDRAKFLAEVLPKHLATLEALVGDKLYV